MHRKFEPGEFLTKVTFKDTCKSPLNSSKPLGLVMASFPQRFVN